MDKSEYDKEPVLYCSTCLSLRVVATQDGIDYCDKCGSTAIESAGIEEWNEKYVKRYGISQLKEK